MEDWPEIRRLHRPRGRKLPVGTAYAVWVGIGAVGASVAGVLVYRDAMTLPQIAALALLVLGILAVRLTN